MGEKLAGMLAGEMDGMTAHRTVGSLVSGKVMSWVESSDSMLADLMGMLTETLMGSMLVQCTFQWNYQNQAMSIL